MIPRPPPQNFGGRWRLSPIRARCLHAPFFYALLAELEAETLGAESALARIDEALALADQVDNRGYLPFMHRLRGEILLKRDPANPGARRGSLPDRHRRREAARRAQLSVCKRRLRSPNSTNRPAAPPKPTPSSRPRSKAFRRRPKCPRSPRRRRLLAELEAS